MIPNTYTLMYLHQRSFGKVAHVTLTGEVGGGVGWGVGGGVGWGVGHKHSRNPNDLSG